MFFSGTLRVKRKVEAKQKTLISEPFISNYNLMIRQKVTLCITESVIRGEDSRVNLVDFIKFKSASKLKN